MKNSSGISLLSGAFVCALLIYAAFQSENAAAGSSEAVRSQIAQAQPGSKRFEDSGAPIETKEAATADAKPDRHAGVDIDESLYPTAAQCGECHKQIYDEWSSSQHAYASISPMFHKFEQKLNDLSHCFPR